MLRLAALLVLTLAACGGGPTSGVELTLRFDDSVSDAALATVRSFSIVSSGDDGPGTYTFTLGRAAHREERMLYRSLSTSHEIGLAVTASDASSIVVASGSQPHIALEPTQATAVEITLDAGDALDASMQLDGGTDASTIVDAAMPGDAAMLDASTGCTPTGKAICETFENPLSTIWTQHQTNGTLDIDTTHANRGTHALHLHGDAVTAGTSVDLRLTETQTMVPLPSDIYVRAYYYFATAFANNTTLSSIVETTSPYEGVSFLFNGSSLGVGDSVGTANDTQAPVSIATNSWVCLEWHLHPAMNTTGSTDVWLAGTPISTLSLSEVTEPSAGLGVLSIGAEAFNPKNDNPVYDVWVDDVIVDVARIGCTL